MTSTADIYKVMIIVECAGNGVTSQVVSFVDPKHAEECCRAVNDTRSTCIEGQIATALRLYMYA